MIIRCPGCSTTYRVNGSAFDSPRPSFRCSRCKRIFALQVRLHEDAPAATEPAAGSAGEPPRVTAESDTRSEPHGRGDANAGDRSAEPGPDAAPGARGAPQPPAAAASEPPAPDLPETHDDTHALREPNGGTADMETAEDDAAGAPRPDEDFAPAAARPPEPPEPAAAAAAGARASRRGRKPDFEIDDDFLIPPRREAPEPPAARPGGSIMPLVSLAALSLFAFVLVYGIYQFNPEPLDSLLRRIPWYGATVFEKRHFKRTLVFEGLASGVQPVLNQTEVFVVSGKLFNRNDRSVHKVRIEAQLFDKEGKQVGRQATFVGNAISPKIIKDMTFREIELLQSLKPQSTYRIPANQSAGFTIVFPKPKAAVESFSCRVLSADAAA